MMDFLRHQIHLTANLGSNLVETSNGSQLWQYDSNVYT